MCECFSECVCLPLPALREQSVSQSVSQPLLRESMLGNSSLEFPWTRSRPPLPSLLPLSHSPPPPSPLSPTRFHFSPLRSDMGLCVCGHDYSQQPVQYNCWFICPVHSGSSPLDVFCVFSTTLPLNAAVGLSFH